MTTVQQPVPTKATTGNLPGVAAAGRRRRRRRTNPVFWVVLVLLALIFVAPLVYMLLTSIKTNVEARSVPPTLFPSEPTLEAFRTLFFADEASPVLLWLANSLISATAHARAGADRLLVGRLRLRADGVPAQEPPLRADHRHPVPAARSSS